MKAAIYILAFTFLAVSTQAATVTLDCTPNPETFPGGNGFKTPSCPAFSVAGATLTGATLLETASFAGGASGINTVFILFIPEGPGTATWTGDALLTLFGDASGSESGAQTASTGVTNANFASSFNVGEDAGVLGGSVGTSSAGLQIEYTYTPATTTPEPSAVSLFAMGLCALPLVTRRRRFRLQ